MPAIVEVEDLTKIYSRRRDTDVVAVSHLEMTLGTAGTVHGFLGPNGSGKTTTIRCLLGLIRPTGGRVRVFGSNSTSSFHEVAGRVGAIVENPKLFPKFSGRRNLQLLADVAGLPKGSVDRVLRIVGLDGRDRDSFESYSLGMRQRLAIAAALLKDPDLLILDEPANGLDPAGIAEMRVLIRSIADEGKAVLVSSHQLAEMEQVCDDVTIINRGELVITGPLDEVRSHGGEDAVVVTIDDRDGAIALLAGRGMTAHPRSRADELKVDVDTARAIDVNRVLAEDGRYLRGLRTEQATLEAAFLNLTGGPPPPTAPTATPPTAPAPTAHPAAGTAPTAPPPPAVEETR
jgi:ABC-2 type transport system ATP-binding protein